MKRHPIVFKDLKRVDKTLALGTGFTEAVMSDVYWHIAIILRSLSSP